MDNNGGAYVGNQIIVKFMSASADSDRAQARKKEIQNKIAKLNQTAQGEEATQVVFPFQRDVPEECEQPGEIEGEA